jgi:hypothetical protein
MSVKTSGSPAARPLGRRWLRSLTVLLSTLALMLGLAPAANAETVRPGNDDFDVTVTVNEGASDLRPGGHAQFDVAIRNEHGSVPGTNLNWYGILVPSGFTLRNASGDIEGVTQNGNYIGGENDGFVNLVTPWGGKDFRIGVNIPADAQAGTNYPIGTRINVRGGTSAERTHEVPTVLNLVLDAVRSATQVSVAPTVARVGEPVTLSAQVSAVDGTNVPTGTVTFAVDGQSLTADVVNGVATTQATFTTTGTKPVTASFTPANAAQWQTSTGTGTVNVQTESTQTDLTLDPVTITAGQLVTATARLTPTNAAGDVVFTVDGQTQRIPVRFGVATAEFELTSAGPHTVLAVFEPTNPARFTTSRDDAVVTVSEQNTTTTVTVNPATAAAGERIQLTASVAPSDATGTVTFTVADRTLTAPVVNGTATVYTSLITAGTHTVRATFASDDPARWVGSTGTGTVQITAVGTTTEVTVDPTTVEVGQEATLIARVTPTDVPGEVVFTVDGQEHRAPVVDGVATARVPFPQAGERTVTATFVPQDTDRYTASSDTATVTVTGGAAGGGSLGSLTGSLGS